MKKTISAILVSILLASLTISCNSTNSEKTKNDGTLTVTARFVNGGSLEGEASLTFEKEDGSKIEFFRNYNNPDEPELKYEFLSNEGIGGNKELIGSTFIINYIEKSSGGPGGMIAEGEPCNQILSVEIK